MCADAALPCERHIDGQYVRRTVPSEALSVDAAGIHKQHTTGQPSIQMQPAKEERRASDLALTDESRLNGRSNLNRFGMLTRVKGVRMNRPGARPRATKHHGE